MSHDGNLAYLHAAIPCAEGSWSSQPSQHVRARLTPPTNFLGCEVAAPNPQRSAGGVGAVRGDGGSGLHDDRPPSSSSRLTGMRRSRPNHEERASSAAGTAVAYPIPDGFAAVQRTGKEVESRMGAVAWGLKPAPRFPSPLIKPSVPISGTRLSDWLHPKAHDGRPLDAGVQR
jgi:hypothetical protein